MNPNSKDSINSINNINNNNVHVREELPTAVKPHVELSIVCRQHGFKTMPSDPRLMTLVEQGITPEVLGDACKVAQEKGVNSINYVIKVMESWKQKAEQINVSGAVKKAPVKQDVWWTSDQGIDRKGRELGLQPKYNETYADYKSRIFETIRERGL